MTDCPAIAQLRKACRAVLALLLCALSAALHAEEKSLKGVALVIGQSKYEHIAPLANPANDAREMVKLLSDLGFDARSVSDRDAAKLRRDLERFVEDAEGADVAFLYYSGHGIEAGGENWLVPVDADVSSLDNAGEDAGAAVRGDGRAERRRAGHHRAARRLPHQPLPRRRAGQEIAGRSGRADRRRRPDAGARRSAARPTMRRPPTISAR